MIVQFQAIRLPAHVDLYALDDQGRLWVSEFHDNRMPEETKWLPVPPTPEDKEGEEK